MENANKSGKNDPEHAHPAEAVITSNEDYNKDVKERLEERYNGNFKVIKFEELLNIAPQFALWFKSIVRYGNVDSQSIIFWDLDEPERFRVLIYTDNHVYSVSGYQGTEKNPKGYLGCTVSTRKPRPGEDWNRGNDLKDGKYSEDTFIGIVKDIVSYELKSIQLYRKS
jgi:hypothetical protein